VRTEFRLAAATLIAFVASNAVAHATRYNFDGTPMAEPTTMETMASWVSGYDILAIVIAFMLPGMPMAVLVPLAALTLCFGWKFAICFSFGYYLLQFLMGGRNDAFE
jgi:hypothetical protein